MAADRTEPENEDRVHYWSKSDFPSPIFFLIFTPPPCYAFSMARSEHHTIEAWALDRLRRLVAQSLKGRLSADAIPYANVKKNVLINVINVITPCF